MGAQGNMRLLHYNCQGCDEPREPGLDGFKGQRGARLAVSVRLGTDPAGRQKPSVLTVKRTRWDLL